MVHPQHGTATVEGMVHKDLGRGPEEYLELYVETASLKIMVPASAVEAVGIRNVSTKVEAEAVLAILAEPAVVPEGWSERNQMTMARVKSHDLHQVSMVVRDLSRHQERSAKPLSLREATLLRECLDVVARELCLALNVSEAEAKALITDTSLAGAEPVSQV